MPPRARHPRQFRQPSFAGEARRRPDSARFPCPAPTRLCARIPQPSGEETSAVTAFDAALQGEVLRGRSVPAAFRNGKKSFLLCCFSHAWRGYNRDRPFWATRSAAGTPQAPGVFRRGSGKEPLAGRGSGRLQDDASHLGVCSYGLGLEKSWRPERTAGRPPPVPLGLLPPWARRLQPLGESGAGLTPAALGLGTFLPAAPGGCPQRPARQTPNLPRTPRGIVPLISVFSGDFLQHVI